MHTARLVALTAALISTAAFASLPNGTKAPDFTTQASLAGKECSFSLNKFSVNECRNKFAVAAEYVRP